MPLQDIIEYYDRLEYEASILAEKDLNGKVVLIIGRSDYGESLNPYLIESYDKAVELFGTNHLTQKYREVADAGAEIIYLLKIDYHNNQEKYKQLSDVYDMLEYLNVDIILLLETELDQCWIYEPEIEDTTEIEFDIQAIKKGKIIGTQTINTIINTNENIVQITDKPVLEYFNYTNVDYEYPYRFAGDYAFSKMMNSVESKDIVINNGILPKEYHTYVYRTGKINDPKGYYPEAIFVTTEFHADTMRNNGKIKGFNIELEGEINDWRDFQSVDIYYWDGERYCPFNYDNKVILDSPLDKIKFKFILNNSNFINPPIIKEIKIVFIISAPDNEVNYAIQNNNSFLNLWTHSNGHDFVYASFDKNKYITENMKRMYFSVQLAKACKKINAIGIIQAPKPIYQQEYEDWFNELLIKMQTIKSHLKDNNEDYGKYLGCILSSVYIGAYGSEYLTDGTGVFVGLLGSLPSNETPVNKDLATVNRIANSFTETEIKMLTEVGYTVFIKTVRNGITPYKAVSLMSDNRSPYINLNKTRLVNEIIKRTKEITDSFIGKGFNLQTESLEKELNQLYEDLIDEDKVDDYSYKFLNISSERIELELSLTLPEEILDVTTTVISEKVI